MQTTAKRWLALTGFVASSLLIIVLSSGAFAADKGVVKADPNGLADLEERIAELEATVAKKGNRKVSLRIYGQVNKAILWASDGDDHDTLVTENSASESFVGFTGEARINSDLKAGFVLEMGVGGYADGTAFGDTNDIYTRRSFVYLESATVGKLSVGHLSMASDEITEITTANTAVASRPLSVRPLVGPQAGEALDIFDGARADGVRYDSPTLQGFKVSASWTNADLVENSDAYDIALRYADDWGQFKVGAGVAMRKGFTVPTMGSLQDLTTYAGSASVMHMPTGVFLTGIAGHIEGDGVLSGLPNIKGWQVQGGLEERWNALGKTTVFAEYGELKVDDADSTPNLIGLGFVQAVDAAALDLYVTGRQYSLDMGDDDFTVVMGGARIKF